MALLSHFSPLLDHYSIYQSIYNTAIADRLIQYNSELNWRSVLYWNSLFSFCQRCPICFTKLLDIICIFVKTTAASFFVIIN